MFVPVAAASGTVWPARVAPPPSACIVKSPATLVPPLSLITCLTTMRCACSELAYVHVQFSPSLMLIVAVVLLVEDVPPFGLVTEHVTLVSVHPSGNGVSLTVYVWNVVMLENTCVFAVVPSSTREKLVR